MHIFSILLLALGSSWRSSSFVPFSFRSTLFRFVSSSSHLHMVVFMMFPLLYCSLRIMIAIADSGYGCLTWIQSVRILFSLFETLLHFPTRFNCIIYMLQTMRFICSCCWCSLNSIFLFYLYSILIHHLHLTVFRVKYLTCGFPVFFLATLSIMHAFWLLFFQLTEKIHTRPSIECATDAHIEEMKKKEAPSVFHSIVN